MSKAVEFDNRLIERDGPSSKNVPIFTLLRKAKRQWLAPANAWTSTTLNGFTGPTAYWPPTNFMKELQNQ